MGVNPRCNPLGCSTQGCPKKAGYLEFPRKLRACLILISQTSANQQFHLSENCS